MKNKNEQKDFFTPGQLARVSWFPIKSENTIRSLIKTGIIKAINTSSIAGKMRYLIPKDDVFNYLKSLAKKELKKASKAINIKS